MSRILAMTTTTVPTSHVTPYPGNARQGDMAALTQSLEHNGQYRPLVVQSSTGYVLAGNHTLAAAQQLGWTQVAVQYIDVDDDAAKRILLADNRTNDGATYDDQLLARLLDSVDEPTGTGFTDEEIDDLLATLEEATPLADPDPAPTPAPPAPTTEPGPAPKSSTVIDANTATFPSSNEYRDQYETSERRSVQLFYWGADYIWIVEQLAALAKEIGTDSNADTVAALIAQTTNTTRPSHQEEQDQQ